MRVGCIVQARQTSKRLPNKILKKIENKTIIEHIYKRLKKIKKVDKIIFAIPKNSKNFKLKNLLIKNKINHYSGSEKNVLKRYFETAKANKIDIIMRITSDCPLIDPILCSNMLSQFLKLKIDYMSNILTRSFPQGLDCEIFTFSALEKSVKLVKDNFEKEHVTPFMKRSNIFKKKNYLNKLGYMNDQRWTLDYKEDLEMIKIILKNKKLKKEVKWIKIYNFYKKFFCDKPYINQKYTNVN
jgi:spore coat polysaccharide biosynthesis protein SpsF (cytidylyltransferase family)